MLSTGGTEFTAKPFREAEIRAAIAAAHPATVAGLPSLSRALDIEKLRSLRDG